MASKSYPIQSIKRREQGTIVSVLTINKDGKLINIEIKDKAPKRLYKATAKILKAFANFQNLLLKYLTILEIYKSKYPLTTFSNKLVL